MNGILQKKENGWFVKYTECCIDNSNDCKGSKAICLPNEYVLPLHPDSVIWIEEYPVSKYVFQMLYENNECEVNFEIFETPIFSSSGLIGDIKNVEFARLYH